MVAMNNDLNQEHIAGGCHCGNIHFTLAWPDQGGDIPVRACTCSFCRKHGGTYTSNPKAALRVQTGDLGRVQIYSFGTGTADFHICQVCGVMPIVTSRIDGHLYGIVNVNCFEGVDPARLDATPRDFEGETVDSRLTRRKASWISDVAMDSPLPAT